MGAISPSQRKNDNESTTAASVTHGTIVTRRVRHTLCTKIVTSLLHSCWGGHTAGDPPAVSFPRHFSAPPPPPHSPPLSPSTLFVAASTRVDGILGCGNCTRRSVGDTQVRLVVHAVPQPAPLVFVVCGHCCRCPLPPPSSLLPLGFERGEGERGLSCIKKGVKEECGRTAGWRPYTGAATHAHSKRRGVPRFTPCWDAVVGALACMPRRACWFLLFLLVTRGVRCGSYKSPRADSRA